VTLGAIISSPVSLGTTGVMGIGAGTGAE